MFLNAVVLILQEILEAALLIAVLMVLGRVFFRQWLTEARVARSWVGYAVALGAFCAWGYAAITPTISEWFDYVGQEVMNALLHFCGLLGLVILCFIVPSRMLQDRQTLRIRIAYLSMLLVVTLALVREGSEIIIYLTGVTGQGDNVMPVLLGGSIGAGIGISCGIFLYYTLISLSPAWTLRIGMILLALISGNMASQIIMLLSQADWIPYTATAWDSSSLLAENSIPGHLLYALVGYESSPSIMQAVCYLLGIVLILLSPLFRITWSTSQESRLHAHV